MFRIWSYHDLLVFPCLFAKQIFIMNRGASYLPLWQPFPSSERPKLSERAWGGSFLPSTSVNYKNKYATYQKQNKTIITSTKFFDWSRWNWVPPTKQICSMENPVPNIIGSFQKVPNWSKTLFRRKYSTHHWLYEKVSVCSGLAYALFSPFWY